LFNETIDMDGFQFSYRLNPGTALPRDTGTDFHGLRRRE